MNFSMAGLAGISVDASIGRYPYGHGAERQKWHSAANAQCTAERQLAENGSADSVGCAGGSHRSGSSSAS